MSNQNDIPDYLRSTHELLQCAFPEGIEVEDYFPLIAILRGEGHMSFRNIAVVLSAIMHKPYIEAYNDASGFQSDDISDQGDIERVKRRLASCNYEQWLKES